MSLRADFFGDLQKDELLYEAHRQINVPPLREAQLHEVVSRPAALLGVRFETDHLAADISRRAAEESSKDAGALPLLSYLLDDMWKCKDPKWDGVLRLPAPAIELGRVLVDRANAFMAEHPGADEKLRRIFTLKLATVREDGEPTRRRAFRLEFSDDEWRLVSELADNPNRLLITAIADNPATPVPDTACWGASVMTAAAETYAEVAHEAIFRRWDKLREWIAAEREFLAWRTGLEHAHRAWAATPDASKHDALLMGVALAQAQSWLAKRAEDLPAPEREFITQSVAREKKAQTRARRVRSLIYVLLVGVIAVLVERTNQSYIAAQWRWWWTGRPFVAANIWPYALKPAAELALKPEDTFRECSAEQGKDYCPLMVVLPAGSFIMGSPATEQGHQPSEEPQHQVTIAKLFAVSKFALTFDEWDTCVNYGDCPQGVADSGWGHGQQPVINVTWDDAQHYVAWLSKMTGKTYRLLTESEYEYAARAGATTTYPWGDDIGIGNSNCKGCGSRWDNTQTAPVGSFAANAFGLFDMVGNVWGWVEDCVNNNYDSAPTDGSAWIERGDCKNRIVRGGSWNNTPANLRCATRVGISPGFRDNLLGFRVARTIIP